jgi:hypothetical protein
MLETEKPVMKAQQFPTNTGKSKSNGKNMIEIAAEVKRETAKAFLVDDGNQEVWLPKSQVEMSSDGVFNVAEWLAREKGFIS